MTFYHYSFIILLRFPIVVFENGDPNMYPSPRRQSGMYRFSGQSAYSTGQRVVGHGWNCRRQRDELLDYRVRKQWDNLLVMTRCHVREYLSPLQPEYIKNESPYPYLLMAQLNSQREERRPLHCICSDRC